MNEPLDVLDFHNFMKRSYLILTDSGIYLTKTLHKTLVKIKAGKIDGKWVVYPIKKSVQRLCEKCSSIQKT